MALTLADIALNYSRLKGWIDSEEDVRRVINVLSSILMIHAQKRKWNYLNSTETVASTSAVYLTPSALLSIDGVALATVGELDLISYDQYQDRYKKSSTTSTTPREYAVSGSLIYPYQPPTSGLSFSVWGQKPVTSVTIAITSMPDSHEPAIHKALDVYFGQAHPMEYETLVGGLWTPEACNKGRVRKANNWFRIVSSSAVTESTKGDILL